jgi:hypothetical protein
MTKKFHGMKRYMQILLHPNRSELLDRLAEERGVRCTALVRELVYQGLERVVTRAEYAAAVAADELLRTEAIKNQVDGRKSKQDVCG